MPPLQGGSDRSVALEMPWREPPRKNIGLGQSSATSSAAPSEHRIDTNLQSQLMRPSLRMFPFFPIPVQHPATCPVSSALDPDERISHLHRAASPFQFTRFIPVSVANAAARTLITASPTDQSHPPPSTTTSRAFT